MDANTEHGGHHELVPLSAIDAETLRRTIDVLNRELERRAHHVHEHDWSWWRETSGKFDASGTIESRYSRWCKTCRAVDEMTLPGGV